MFRHYWVLFKLLMTLFATIILLIYLQTFSALADVAGDAQADIALVRNPSPLIHAVLALLVLLVPMSLSVFKPRGKTRFGQRRQAGRLPV